ncbi:alpha/beta fold hydrolase [Aquimarina sp. I32.4]|uniref:alpha/beta fold hydrolase n=1 Tax=Aquimarina sp. I32.4 TaxID=2053903 RepID=UPI000CDE612F|nr:alpha/beta hydrolase [Aquimarina sp. I32.4]
MSELKYVNAGDLCVAYEESGHPDGIPVLLLHGFPYDIRAYDEVVSILESSCRIITPYLRGFGLTRFISNDTLRTGEQAALAHDLLALMDALSIPKAILAGYDWGGRAACIVAALWSDRVIALISGGGYNIQNIVAAKHPQTPEKELLYWYQFYFHTERGQEGLAKYPKEFCKLLWKLWSPTWQFDDATYQETADSFMNPDFVAVVIHSYRHRFGLVEGDSRFEETEKALANQPQINVPTIVLDGDSDGVIPLESDEYDAPYFIGEYQRRIIKGAGHNLPQEKPQEFASAILSFIE